MSTVFLLSKDIRIIELLCTNISKSGNICIHFETVQQLYDNVTYTKPDILLIDYNFISTTDELSNKIECNDSNVKTIIFNKPDKAHSINTKSTNISNFDDLLKIVNSYIPSEKLIFDNGVNKLFDLIFNNLPEPATITTLDEGKILKVNSKFLEVSGFTEDEVINQSSIDKFLWVKKEKREKYIDQLKKKQHIRGYKSYFFNKYKETICCHISSVLFYDKSRGYILSVLDNHIKNEILAEKLNETQKIARVGSYTLDFGTGRWSSSKVLNSIFEITGDYDKSIEGWLKIVHPRWRETMSNYLQEKVITKGEEFDKQYQITTVKTKTVKWVHGRGSLLYKDEKLVKMIGTIIDITDFKEIEEKLKKKQSLLDDIIKTSPVGILLTNKVGDIYYINKRGEEILEIYADKYNPIKYNASEWKVTDLDGTKLPEEKLPFALVKKDLKAVYGIKLAIESEIFGQKILSINATPILKEGNEFNGMIASIEDITNQITYEKKIQDQNQQLEELVSFKDKLFSILGHDLRSPIGNMNQLSNFLNSDFESLHKTDIINILTNIENVSEQALHLIENILEWSRIERCQVKPKLNTICIEDLFNHAVDLHKSLADKKCIKLIKDIEVDECIECDIDMTKTVLRNLISNAIKFTLPGNSVRLISKSVGHSYIEISVKDQGVGIPEEDLGHLFNYAFNKPRKGTGKENGTGFGLPLCKELIELQGGEIYVKENSIQGVNIAFKLQKKHISGNENKFIL